MMKYVDVCKYLDTGFKDVLGMIYASAHIPKYFRVRTTSNMINVSVKQEIADTVQPELNRLFGRF